MVHRTATGITIAQSARSKDYKINAEEITEEDGVFRKWKVLEEAFQSIPGIKKNPIAEVQFDAVDEEGMRQVNVSYRLVNQSHWSNVVILKRGQTWPKPGVLSRRRQPERVPWSKLAFKRWEKLNNYIDDLSTPPTPQQRAYYQQLPHIGPEAFAAPLDRGGNAVVAQPPAVAAPTTAPTTAPNDDTDASDSDSECSMELEEGLIGAIAANDAVAEGEKDDAEDEFPSGKRSRSRSPSLDSSPPLFVANTPSRAQIIAALAPTAYEVSSRWNRSVPPPGAKRIRKRAKHDDL